MYLKTFTSFHTDDCTTPLLIAQRVSPLGFVGVNKHRFSKVRHLIVNQDPPEPTDSVIYVRKALNTERPTGVSVE